MVIILNNKLIVVSLLLLITLTSILTVGINKFYSYEEDRSVNILAEYTRHIRDKIFIVLTKDYAYLSKIAQTLSGQDLNNHKEISSVMKSFGKAGAIDHLELVFTDDRLLTENGKIFDVSDEEQSFINSFNTHISGKLKDVENPAIYVVRHNIPIYVDSKPVAVLCGVIDISVFPDSFLLNDYDKQFNVAIVESHSQNVLVNNMFNIIGNIENISGWRLNDDSVQNRIASDFRNIKSGEVAFLSNQDGNKFYAYYEPIGISDWMIMLTSPESNIFSYSSSILSLFFVISGVILLIFIGFFLWIVERIRKEKKNTENQLKTITYMLDVENKLFMFHVDSNNMTLALNSVAEFCNSQAAFFWSLNPINDRRLWTSGSNTESQVRVRDVFPGFFSLIRQKKEFVAYNIDSVAKRFPEDAEILKSYDIRNIMFIPIPKLNGDTIAMLGIVNMEDESTDINLLKIVMPTFSMMYDFYDSYSTLAKLSKTDMLTNLMNQNSFLIDITRYSGEKYDTFACVYMDANGLHEVNNRLGHQAGDHMLRTVGEILASVYHDDRVYRIGGDEFAVLCVNKAKYEIYEKSEKALKLINKSGYEISVGIEWRNDNLDIKEIVNMAEKTMQADKKRFYTENGGKRMIRVLDDKLQKLLQEKRAADSFLNVIAPKFKCVYSVELNNNVVTHIFNKAYMEELLEEVSGDFNNAVKLYAERAIAEEYKDSFEVLCNYDKLKNVLKKEGSIDITAEKNDGSIIKIQVIRTDADDNLFETLWIFNDDSLIPYSK